MGKTPGKRKILLKCLGIPHAEGVDVQDLTHLSVLVAVGLGGMAGRDGAGGAPSRRCPPSPTSSETQAGGGRERAQRERERERQTSFHSYRMVLFFYLFANVQCNGLKPSRVAAAAHTQSCSTRSSSRQTISRASAIQPEPTPGQAAHSPRVPSPPHTAWAPPTPPTLHSHN